MNEKKTNKFITEITLRWEMFTYFLHSEVLGTSSTIFNIIIRATFMSFAMQHSRRLSIFGGPMKPRR